MKPIQSLIIVVLTVANLYMMHALDEAHRNELHAYTLVEQAVKDVNSAADAAALNLKSYNTMVDLYCHTEEGRAKTACGDQL